MDPSEKTLPELYREAVEKLGEYQCQVKTGQALVRTQKARVKSLWAIADDEGIALLAPPDAAE